ncbi:hypothetical protein NtRootA9_10840 [Arthrobacter sp. NtRootA9]|nr:hypothetical protein NtRootA9_10840 [Arthrobacter sp. NtRootA9]
MDFDDPVFGFEAINSDAQLWVSVLCDGSLEDDEDEWLEHQRIPGQIYEAAVPLLAALQPKQFSFVLRQFLPDGLGPTPFEEIQFEYRSRELLDAFIADNVNEYERRLVSCMTSECRPSPCPDLTWVIDLYQDSPRMAFEVMEAYLHAHIWVLHDKAIDGILDAMAIMRYRLNRDLGPDFVVQSLRALTSRELEYLVAALWHKLGYSVIVTPATRDGGRDVEARMDVPGQKLTTFIEVKQWSAGVNVSVVRDLIGVLTDERTAKGVVVAPGGFTKGPDSATELAERNPRIELVDGPLLGEMLANNFGEKWFLRIDRLIQEVKRAVLSGSTS